MLSAGKNNCLQAMNKYAWTPTAEKQKFEKVIKAVIR